MRLALRVLLFSFNLHVERSPLGHKIRNVQLICFQLFLPTFKPFYCVKNSKFLEFGEGEEERMELERPILPYKREKSRSAGIGYSTYYFSYSIKN